LPGHSFGACHLWQARETRMSGRRQRIRVLVGTAESGSVTDANSVADDLARDLQTDTVSAWAEEVDQAIAAARAGGRTSLPSAEDGIARKRRSIEEQIARLQEELKALGRPGSGGRH